MQNDRATLVWISAIIVAAIGAWIMFDAEPGLNWGLWTAAAAIGLVAVARSRGTLGNPTLLMLGVAVLFAAGAAVTADELIAAVICLSVMLFLALSMLMSIAPAISRISLPFVVTAPFVAGGNALAESFRRVLGLTGSLRSSRARGAIRGTAITVPVVIFFALLLSNADPVFAGWRDEFARIIETWSFVPRTIFFLVLLVIVLGAYSYADRATRTDAISPSIDEASGYNGRWLGATERLILLSGVAGLFWLFIAVQLSYLFGNAPKVVGSGMTFAEYAQRGFAELTIVATCSVILIVISERNGRINGNARTVRALTLALLVAVGIILISAYHRVTLYEAAYGYTVSRMYAQVYMLVLAFALVSLIGEVVTSLDARRLFRRVFAVAVFALLVLVYWNHEAWIASANIDRFARTGKLDARYLAADLSLNAVPTVISRMKTLPEPQRTLLKQELIRHYSRPHQFEDAWFEWNLRRAAGRSALASILPLAPAPRTREDLTASPVAVSTRP